MVEAVKTAYYLGWWDAVDALGAAYVARLRKT
jgi:hypothetical protein